MDIVRVGLKKIHAGNTLLRLSDIGWRLVADAIATDCAVHAHARARAGAHARDRMQ